VAAGRRIFSGIGGTGRGLEGRPFACGDLPKKDLTRVKVWRREGTEPPPTVEGV
jgi:hypothetical protein